MKNLLKLTNIIESVIFVSGNKVAISDIAEKLEISEKEVLDCVKELQKKYSGENGIHLLLFNKKVQFCSNPEYADAVSSVLNPIKERELSKSMLEVAAIIAYKQPVTRIDLEEIRGNSEYAVQKLLELGMIEPVGRKDAVGKPVLFGTTDEFLKRFQISSLDELPDYDELLTKISLIRGEEKNESYLFAKPVYKEESENNEPEVAVTVSPIEDPLKKINKPSDDSDVGDGDFELPDIEDEELPDFLTGEDVTKI